MKTGWPPGLLQDDDRKLSRWFAGRLGARYQVRMNMTTQQTRSVSDLPEALRLADELGVPHQCDFHIVCEEAAAELRRLHAVNAELLKALKVAVRQNSHDMLMTGDELRQCGAAIAKAEGRA